MTAKTGEYKYKVTVSKTRKINTGNYQSEDVFESMTGGCDKKNEVEDLHQYLEGLVNEAIDRRAAEILTGLPGGDFATADKASMLKPEGRPQTLVEALADGEDFEVVDEDDDGNLWPTKIPCRGCNNIIEGRDSKFKHGEKYYQCDTCKDKNGKPMKTWPDWYRKQKGWL
jgi:hypothetical protein